MARPPEEINIGAVIRELEGNFYLAECLNPQRQGVCAVQSICGLTGLLNNALRQYMVVLDSASLSDVVPQMNQIDKVDSS